MNEHHVTNEAGDTARIVIGEHGHVEVTMGTGNVGTRLDIDLAIADGSWREHLGDQPEHGMLTRIGVLPHGMKSGRPSVSMIVTLDDGRRVHAEASYRNFSLAALALLQTYGTP